MIQPLRVIQRIEREERGVGLRTEWPAGPWDAEPDLMEWRDEVTGYPCLIVRGPMGALCGYVGLTEGHPYYGKDYDDVPANAHGGLTYSARCGEFICHVPQPGESDQVWWLGFDCAHAWDLCPGLLIIGRRRRELMPGETYKGITYVQGEVTKLAAELKGLS